MSVYVDNYRAKFGRMVMCHMVADTIAELHAMADAIGLKRSWFQSPPKASVPHYDVSLTMRAAALDRGAVSVDRSKLVEVVRRARAAGWP